MPFVRNFLKKNSITIILFCLVYSWFFISSTFNKPSNIPILGTSGNILLFREPDAGKAPLLNEIKNAKEEILVEVYLLSDKDIIQALIDSKKRGVDVSLILEEHPFGGGSLNNKSKKTLEDNNIDVKWSSSKFALTHEKAIIIDKKEVFILNQNLTASSFVKNREYDVLDTNPNDVLQARNVFVADWEEKSISSNTDYLVLSPINSRIKISSLLNSGTKSIEIEDEIIEDKQIINLLKEKAKNVNIKIIIPTFSQVESNKIAVSELIKSGILVKVISSPYIHAKLILIDDKTAYVGSINLSSQSMDENRELGIILSEAKSINLLNQTFDLDWSKAASIN